MFGVANSGNIDSNQQYSPEKCNRFSKKLKSTNDFFYLFVIFNRHYYLETEMTLVSDFQGIELIMKKF